MEKNFEINNCGSITQIAALNPEALQWLHDNLFTESWQWFGNIVNIDSRYAEDIVMAINDEFDTLQPINY